MGRTVLALLALAVASVGCADGHRDAAVADGDGVASLLQSSSLGCADFAPTGVTLTRDPGDPPLPTSQGVCTISNARVFLSVYASTRDLQDAERFGGRLLCGMGLPSATVVEGPNWSITDDTRTIAAWNATAPAISNALHARVRRFGCA